MTFLFTVSDPVTFLFTMSDPVTFLFTMSDLVTFLFTTDGRVTGGFDGPFPHVPVPTSRFGRRKSACGCGGRGESRAS